MRHPRHAVSLGITAEEVKLWLRATQGPRLRCSLECGHQATLRPLLSGKIGLMPKHLSAEDIFPLIGCLSPHERLRLLRFISARPAAEDRDVYRALPPRNEEFSSDEDLLAWDAEGWEEVR